MAAAPLESRAADQVEREAPWSSCRPMGGQLETQTARKKSSLADYVSGERTESAESVHKRADVEHVGEGRREGGFMV